MDAKQALAKIRSLEADDAAELASVLENALESAEQKAFATIGEKRTATQKNQAFAETLEAIARNLNLDGSVDELLDKLPGAVQEARRSADELKTKAETYEQQLTEAQGKVQTFERKGKLATIAAAAGANPAVLERLFSDQLDTLVVGEDGVVKLGEVPLAEAVAADDTLKAFAPALFTAAADPAPAPKPGGGKLPGGSPAPAPAADPVAAYVGKTYGGAKALGIGGKKE